MTNINNLDVQNLYKLNSNQLTKTPREDYAKADLKNASWLTRKVINLREPTSKFAVINKIGKCVAWILSCLLFKSSNTFIARRNEILTFNFTDRENYTRLFKSIPEIANLSASSSYKDFVTADLDNPTYRYIDLTKKGAKKPFTTLGEENHGEFWTMKANNNYVIIKDGVLFKNSKGEFQIDAFADYLRKFIAKETASKAE